MKLWVKIVRTGRRVWAIAMHHPKALFLIGIIIGSFLGHTISVLMTEASYKLTNGSVQLIGNASPAISNKLKLDKNIGAYRFNAEAITPEMAGESDPSKVAALLASQKQQTGGGAKDSKNLYSLDLPIDPSQGTKIYDINSKTSFKLIPEFEMGAGRTEGGRVVYPIEEGGQAVYTVKANGVKEDIVLQKPRGDELTFKYKLELPKTLEARLDIDGNLGIYSVDPMVSSAIAGALQNGSSSTDTERLKDVQENGTKDHLTYLIPAPTIIQSGDNPDNHKARAVYKLDDDVLTVSTSGLETLTYPISIDPTVVVTSTNDFTTGDDEGMIQFDVDAISRSRVTMGTISAWSGTTSLAAAQQRAAAVIYNNKMYSIGGSRSGTYYDTVRFASINPDGTIGAWTPTTSIPAARDGHASVVYGGKIYVMGGYDGTSRFNDVIYASVNPDGTIGAWTATTNLSFSRQDLTVLASNGYLYVIGGRDETTSYYNDVQYAPINANGSIGAWTATTGFTAGRSGHTSVVYKGYMYVLGGGNASGYQSDVQYAPINANGSIGAWTATTSLAGNRSGQSAVAYNNYIYTLGGIDSTGTVLPDVQVAAVNPVPSPTFNTSNWSSTTILGAGSGSATAKATTRHLHSSVAHNGYLYLIGGQAGTTPTATVHYAPTNADGSLGAWVASTNPLPIARHSHKSVVVNNGYIYVFGGIVSGSASNTILYSLIGANGLNGGWSSMTPTGISFQNQGVAEYNGYLYVTGGGASATNTVHYSLIGANGLPGTWMATTVLPEAINQHMSIAYNGYLYAMAGIKSSGSNNAIFHAPINANGTVGVWSTASNVPSAASNLGLHVYEGYMIINAYSKMRSGSFTEADGETWYAKVNTNGTVGTWTAAGTVYTDARINIGSAMYNGYIYTTGGRANTTTYGDALYAKLTMVIPGVGAYGTAGTWQTATNVNNIVYGHRSVAYNGRLYVNGGIASVFSNATRYAPINGDGTVGAWTTASNVMTTARYKHGLAVYNGYLYASGGQTASSVWTNSVEYAQILADGSVGPWQLSPNSLPGVREGQISVAYGGRLYVIAGVSGGAGILGDAMYATINANGSIGTWTATTSTLPVNGAAGLEYGGYVYIVGGGNGVYTLDSVRYAKINTDGTLGAWNTSETRFTTGRTSHGLTALNGYLYLSGGERLAGAYLGDTQYAPINPDGSIGAWQVANSITSISGGPTAYFNHSMVAHRGGMYIMGGRDATPTSLATTYRVGLNAPDLKATYSKTINLGQASTLNSVATNGIYPAGRNDLLFRTAGSDGVFGNWQQSSALSGSPQSGVQYVAYKVVMDDSLNSSLSASNGRFTVSDVTVDYTPPIVALTPESRLRQNKYFDASGVLQPLQTQ